MDVDPIRVLIVALSGISSILLSLLVWNARTFLSTFNAHVVKDDEFAQKILVLTTTMIESNKNIDQRLQRIERKLWD